MDHKDLVADKGLFKGLHAGMGLAAKGMVLAFVVFTALNVEFANSIYSAVRGWIEAALNWYYISALVVMLFACLYLMFSRHGKVRLGDDDSRPEFSNFSWFAMLFSAGVGIGLLFFGIAEPMFYFDNTAPWGYPNNPFADQEGVHAMSEQRAVLAMRVTYFHWGFHGWAVYVMIGLCLAYFGFRKKLPLTLRSSLYPVIGDRIYGPIGHAVDLLAVFGTVFGVATSLGLGVSQMATGLNHLFGIDPGVTTQMILIVVISIVATFSAVSGVGNGIRIISEWNIWLSVVLLAFFLFGGPFKWLMGFFVTTVGDYHLERHPDGLPHLQHRRRRGLAGRLDDLLLGLVDLLGAVRRHVHRAHQPRPDHPRVHGRRACSCRPPSPSSGSASSAATRCTGAERRRRRRHGGHRPAHPRLEPAGGPLRHDRPGDDDQLACNWAMAALATFLLATWFITSSDSGHAGDHHDAQHG